MDYLPTLVNDKIYYYQWRTSQNLVNKEFHDLFKENHEIEGSLINVETGKTYMDRNPNKIYDYSFVLTKKEFCISPMPRRYSFSNGSKSTDGFQ
jgi:hypothetical protein